MFEKTAVNFNDYYGTPLVWLFLILVALSEGFLAFRFLSRNYSGVILGRLMLTFLIANIVSFFSEHSLSILLNGGHRTLIWIPWVKILGGADRLLYFISFPIIFLFTVLSEFVIAAVFLKSKYGWRNTLKLTFLVNLISTLLLIVIFNCLVFSRIDGKAEGYWNDLLPQIPKTIF